MIKCNIRCSKAKIAFKHLSVGALFRIDEDGDIYYKTATVSTNVNTDSKQISEMSNVAVNLNGAYICYFANELMVEEVHNAELLYDTTP